MRLFGTDGVRGLANGETLTASLALDLAVSAAQVLIRHDDFASRHESGRPLAVVGRDPRISGQFLQAAVMAGLASAGVDVLDLGVIPTPGIAYLTDALDADLGVVITASHNPMPDNGIKFLQRGGVKLDDVLEDEIEARLGQPWERPTGAALGRISDASDALERYVAHLTGTLRKPLAGLTVVVDCAQGASSASAPLALENAGATVIAIHNAPTGLDINDHSGATHTEALQRAVVEHGADCGFAFDGDADRCIGVDHEGNVVDGDQLIAIMALALQEQGRLVDDTVVVTVMSNLGFLRAMQEHGITVRQTAVGDRYVLEDMRAGRYVVGGEQSGHIILSEYATTGDGTLTALQILERMVETGRSLAELAAVMRRFPQVLLNVPDVDKSRTDDPELVAAVEAEQKELGDAGRILLRPSGTEPLVRVMVEAETQERAHEVAERLADVVRRRLALRS
jgi:phosphoglucosamine mutase